VPGYPIRTSSDPRSVDNSPRHIAASHVLHRLSMPRHPPCALTHLQTQKPKFSKSHKRTRHPHKATHPLDARNHYPITKHHTPPPSEATTPTPNQGAPVLSQDPTVCRWRCPPENPKTCCCAPDPRPLQTETPHGPHPPTGHVYVVLLRKEVIQPHLPVRLPCYDFVPIADPTFDSSPHKG
jgi:hypothetical protein